MTTSTTLRVIACTCPLVLAAFESMPAFADGIAPPPPSIAPPPPEIYIPKAIRKRFSAQVYPDYLQWIGSSEGQSDCIAAFELYLVLHPVNQFEQFCYMQLYSNRG